MRSHPSHHLSDHAVPVAIVILTPVVVVLHQVNAVFEAELLGELRQQVHAVALQLGAFGHGVWVLL